MNSEFTPINKGLYKSHKGADDLRIGDLLTQLDSSTHALLGYPDDQGIKLNGGRIGAKQGPDRARKYLYKMTQNPFITDEISLHDCGNLNVSSEIASNHSKALQQVESLLSDSKKIISIGGGHDYAYPDGAAFLRHCKDSIKAKPIIINIDAHLDVRPLDKGLTSGTPFFRLLEEFSDFDFFEIGIQSQCNSKSHIEWVKSKGAQLLSYDEIITSGRSFNDIASEFLAEHLLKPRPCFLSVDIDAFNSSYAMGCSQSWPTGLTPEPFLQWFKVLKSRLNILNLGVYELSPPLDLDDRTSKLVAQIIYEYLQ